MWNGSFLETVAVGQGNDERGYPWILPVQCSSKPAAIWLPEGTLSRFLYTWYSP